MLKRTVLLSLLLALAGAAGAVKEVKTIIHTDHLGSPIMGRSMDGETLWERHYEPYGSQDLAPDDPASAGYTGHLEERDSGLVYAGARWYDPRIGRFMSPDPIGFTVGNEVSFNRYAYANNNPVAYVDPDGRAAGLVLIGLGAFLVMENANTPDVGEKTSKYSAAGLAPGAIVIGGGVIVEAGFIGAAAAGTGARLATKGATELSKSAQKGVRSLEKRIAEHEKKLVDFKANPTVRPGMEGQPESVIKAAQESRIRHLEKEIQTFKANIEKLKGGQ